MKGCLGVRNPAHRGRDAGSGQASLWNTQPSRVWDSGHSPRRPTPQNESPVRWTNSSSWGLKGQKRSSPPCPRRGGFLSATLPRRTKDFQVPCRQPSSRLMLRWIFCQGLCPSRVPNPAAEMLGCELSWVQRFPMACAPGTRPTGHLAPNHGPMFAGHLN